MTPEEWQRVKRIASEALEQSEADRADFVATECGSDDRLRAEVLSLLESSEQAAGLYEVPMFDRVSMREVVTDIDRVASPMIGQRIGPYRIVSELGRGGMGAAYLAERDDRAFEKRVAIKLIKRGMDTDAILRRFRHERQILANLSHPNIATLLDGGTTEDGRPYFVMEYIDGLPIDVFCDRHQLSVRDRLELFRRVCAAVHYAHVSRIVHRDLKPANILVASDGTPKLLDFGIAKLLGSDDAMLTAATTMTGRAMTPQYASPEQLRGEAITPSSDIYSLGVLLYVVLTGRLPYPVEGRTQTQIERSICEEQPARPSDALDGKGRDTADGRRQRDLAGDVDSIVMTALEKQPERRYPTVHAFAEDIERHLAGLAVNARPQGLETRFRGFTKAATSRARIAMVAAALVLLIMLGIGGSFVVWRPSGTAATSVTSLAVLPLANVGANPEIDFLTEGMTDSLINRLSGVPRLKVIAHDSVFGYKGATTDYDEIARQLGVQAVLKGNVASSGDRLQVGVELIDLHDQRSLWTAHYDRQVGEMQALQTEIAQQVVGHLQLTLTEAQQSRVRQAFTADSDAYQLYLRGRYVWNKRRTDDFRKSISYFQQALDRDPRFALAYSGLADAHSLLTEYHAEPATGTYQPATRAAARALELDAGLAEAHTSLAYIKQFYEWDWHAAEREYAQSIHFNPNYATAHQWFAEFLSARGRHDEALAMIRQAEKLDPLSLIINAVEANVLYMARRYDEAIEKSRQIIAMDADFPEVYEYLKRSYDQKGQYAQAIVARQTRRRLLGLPTGDTAALRAAASTTAHDVYWRNRLAQELEEGKDEGLQPFEMAEILAQAGDRARALDWLEKACDQHDFMLQYIRVAPNLDPLRGEPRFLRLLERSCRV
jgi:eukaryotic-like serine/threonine-protein kinase